MNSNHYRALTLRTLVAICLTALLIADSQAQTEAALKNDKDGSGVDIVVQGALDSELQPLLAALWSARRRLITARSAHRTPTPDRELICPAGRQFPIVCG